MRESGYVPVMAHGLEDGIVELDRAWDEQGRMFWLVRHFLLLAARGSSSGAVCVCGRGPCQWTVGNVVLLFRLPLGGEWRVNLEG